MSDLEKTVTEVSHNIGIPRRQGEPAMAFARRLFESCEVMVQRCIQTVEIALEERPAEPSRIIVPGMVRR